MYAPEFDYYKAGSVNEARELLAQHPDAKLLAGGHSLIPILKLRLAEPSALIDIGRIDALRGIDADGDTIRIGALTTHSEIAASEIVSSKAEALGEAAGQIGDPAVRNRGTIGGNVAHADPASDLPAVLACLCAGFVIEGPGGGRTLGASGFFQGLMTTALGEDEVLTGIEVPAAQAGEASAYAKFPHPASRYAVIGAAAKIGRSNGVCTSARVVVGGLVTAPVRATEVEAALAGQELTPEAIAQASKQVIASLDDDDLLGDVFASAAYRKASAHVWVRRAVAAAAARTS